MVDVSDKAATARRAVAEALVVMSQETLTLIIDGHATKGDVMAVAELAGIMGAKRTAELIPLCHPIALTDVGVEITPDRKASALRITAHAATVGPTGVEMEALTAASIAALTAYDMLKSADRGIRIEGLRLVEKRGGKSGAWQREPDDARPKPGTARPVRRSRPTGRAS
jgi:cyclic pyranopterin phosphate synthase